MNISITEDAYRLLKNLKRGDQSFSDIILSLVGQKDISRCYGLLKGYDKEMAVVEEEALKTRRRKWRKVEF